MTNNENTKYEIIKFEDGDFSLDVNVSPNEETVWLTQAQIAELYDVDRSRVTRHINNILNENELEIKRNVRKTHFPNSDKLVFIYDLDMVLAVGYRVNSKRGILFRRWANSILKQFLLNGHAINETRCLAHSDNIIKMNNIIESMNTRMDNFELRLDTITSTTYFKYKIFYDGQLYEGYSFIKNLFDLSKTNKSMIYKNIEIVNVSTISEAKEILAYYRSMNYEFISFTESRYKRHLIDYFKGDANTHEVIGQEYDNVVMFLDSEFYYRNNELTALEHPCPNYLFDKLLYQGITRVRENLCIVIFDNIDLSNTMRNMRYEE